MGGPQEHPSLHQLSPWRGLNGAEGRRLGVIGDEVGLNLVALLIGRAVEQSHLKECAIQDLDSDNYFSCARRRAGHRWRKS